MHVNTLNGVLIQNEMVFLTTNVHKTSFCVTRVTSGGVNDFMEPILKLLKLPCTVVQREDPTVSSLSEEVTSLCDLL